MMAVSTSIIAVGLDEAGRGCLAGPVIAGAVVLPDDLSPFEGLTDSKKLSPKRRETLALSIRTHAMAFSIGRAEPFEIDQYNILRASLLAMQRAFRGIEIPLDLALIDGLHAPDLPIPTQTLVGGDLTEPAISAASILAKVARDQEMVLADALFPGYGFKVHKGYPTRAHREALARLGVCPLHRKSFGPVRNLNAR